MTDIETVSFLNEEGILNAVLSPSISPEQLVKAYEVMSLTRHVDERMLTLQRQGQISFALSSRGEEACAVGGAAALQIQDWIYPQYRELGVMFWRGFSPIDFVHHMFGDAKDLTLGRQMPNHFGSRAINVVTVSSPIATKIPHAAGSAYAMKLDKDPSVVLCFFGEGATSEGDFHCGLNFAAVRKAPAIFFCRNNGFAISTPLCDQFACDSIASKGVGYGIKAYRVDGNDIFAVYHVVSEARRLCLEGKGPILIEAITYRMGAHSTSDDPTRYRNQNDVDCWNKKCPIKRLKLYLEKAGLWSQQKEDALQEMIKQQVDEAIAIAKKTEPPAIDTLIRDVYFESSQTLQNQLNEVKQALQDGVDHD